jgi:hypothetical protein
MVIIRFLSGGIGFICYSIRIDLLKALYLYIFTAYDNKDKLKIIT